MWNFKLRWDAWSIGNRQREHSSMEKHRDQDREKGAVEQENTEQTGNTSLGGQLGHRDQDPRIKGSDTDFPEPGENPEHSGEPENTPKSGNNAA
jgi:hypothetical protein